jgi:hypothetical protein
MAVFIILVIAVIVFLVVKHNRDEKEAAIYRQKAHDEEWVKSFTAPLLRSGEERQQFIIENHGKCTACKNYNRSRGHCWNTKSPHCYNDDHVSDDDSCMFWEGGSHS